MLLAWLFIVVAALTWPAAVAASYFFEDILVPGLLVPLLAPLLALPVGWMAPHWGPWSGAAIGMVGGLSAVALLIVRAATLACDGSSCWLVGAILWVGVFEMPVFVLLCTGATALTAWGRRAGQQPRASA